MNGHGYAAEQRLLLISAGSMGSIGAAGILIGIWSGSQAVLVDGLFSVAAVVIKLLMLWVSHLTAGETSRRFQFGYWHLEPMVLLTEGVSILVIVLCSGWAALQSLFAGGREVDAGLAVYYAVFFMAVSFGTHGYLRRKNRALGSNLVRYDIVSWYVDVGLSSGLLVSFGAAGLMAYTPWAEMARYADPLIMLFLAVHMVLPALRILCPAARQVLGVAPEAVHDHVRQVMDESLRRFGFTDYVTSVQQYGNTKIIEIDILVAPDFPVQGVSDFDAIRNHIDQAIGYPAHQKWLTITFTATRRWMAQDYLHKEAACRLS